MGTVNVDERDVCAGALLRSMGTARMEFAAGGQLRRVGHHAADRVQPLFSLCHVGQGAEQALCIGVGRISEQFILVAVLNDFAGIDYGDVVAGFGHDAQVMGDEQHGSIVLGLQVTDQFQDLSLDGYVQRGSRLVR